MKNNIDNPLKAGISINEIYDGVFEYTTEEGFHFESFGSNYGRSIYGGAELSNPYVIKKDEQEG